METLEKTQDPMLTSSAGPSLSKSMAPLKMSFTAGVSFPLALAGIGKAIDTYNYLRPHASCDYLTPAQAHSKEGILNKRWSRNNTKKVVITNTNNLSSTL